MLDPKPGTCDVIIPTWQNLRLLQECIKSIKAVTDFPYNIIVVNSGSDGTTEWLIAQQDIIAVNVPERLHFSAAINAGLSVSKAEYVCLLNDDTVVSVDWLGAMMREAVKPNVGAVNPFSNCDVGWLHDEVLTMNGVSLVPSMTLETVEPIIPQLYELRHPKVVTEREWVAFFATVIPRKVIDKVGLLDEAFKSGCEDVDYCRRIKAAGYRMLTTYDSVVFHFGGSTRKRSEQLNNAQHHEEDRLNHQILAAKVLEPADQPLQRTPGKKKFVIYTGQAWEKWTPRSLDDGGIGGSETAAVHVAKGFSAQGYDCYVFGDCGALEGTYDGVQYLNHDKFHSFILSNEIDIFVSSRRADVFSLPIKARKKVVWVHDVWLNNDPNANLHVDKVDWFFCLSPWHKQFFCNHHKSVPPDKVFVTRNGIDLERFKTPLPRERGRMIYTSSPDRGLDVLLDCLPRIKKRVPEAHLHVFYGFDNWEKAIKQRNSKSELAWMENIKRKLKNPGVFYHGRTGQAELAKEFLKSELWAFPTTFTETSCISAMEAMAAGLPAVATCLAALETTVGNSGVMMYGDSRSEAFQESFVNVCSQLLLDKNIWSEYSRRSLENASKCSWSGVVQEWMVQLG